MGRLLLSTAVAIVSAPILVFADDAQDCFQQKDPQLRIKGCSEIIQRDPNDATAYHNRAVAYGLAGVIDYAIADYTKVIEITPDNASAYDNRGRAYASKGDYTNAVADVTKASELMAKVTARTTAATPKPAPPKAAAVPAKTTTKVAAPKAKMMPGPSNNVVKEVVKGDWPAWAKFRDKSEE
jgi:tetratricopeptide (TPR) repeat protein